MAHGFCFTLSDLVCETDTEAIAPGANAFLASNTGALVQKVLDISQ